MTVLCVRALEITDTDWGEIYVSFEAPNWAAHVRSHPFSYRISKEAFREWAENNLPPPLTEDWVDDGFVFIPKGVLFTNKEDALMAYLAFK